jgi:hypothetical protein
MVCQEQLALKVVKVKQVIKVSQVRLLPANHLSLDLKVQRAELVIQASLVDKAKWVPKVQRDQQVQLVNQVLTDMQDELVDAVHEVPIPKAQEVLLVHKVLLEEVGLKEHQPVTETMVNLVRMVHKACEEQMDSQVQLVTEELLVSQVAPANEAKLDQEVLEVFQVQLVKTVCKVLLDHKVTRA